MSDPQTMLCHGIGDPARMVPAKAMLNRCGARRMLTHADMCCKLSRRPAILRMLPVARQDTPTLQMSLDAKGWA